METNNLLSTTKSYYNSTDADEFYFNVWGGEDIHVGIYDTPETKISVASKQTVKKMISVLNTPLTEETKVLDIGSGYGGAARHLAGDYKSQVTCLNLSDKENERNNQKNTETGLNKYISVHAGNFEEIPFEDNQFDVVWCQDAILHSDNKSKVFAEVSRVLKKGGHFIFTDPMQSDNCPDGVLNPILDRIHLKEMGSVKLYRQLAKETGFEEVEIDSSKRKSA